MAVSRYKSEPEYAEGYEVAMKRLSCPDGASPAFIDGHAAACDAVKVLERNGFDETAPGKFTKSFSI